MKLCEFCGASMADEAGFCGTCGRLPSRISQRSTRVSNIPTLHTGKPEDQHEHSTVLGISGQHTAVHTPSGALRPVTLLPIYDEVPEDAEDEQRRQVALFGTGLAILEDVVNHPTLSQTPVINATPQIAQVPTLPNTPTVPQPPAIPGTPHVQGPLPSTLARVNPPQLPHMQPPHPLLPPPATRPLPLPDKPPQQSPSRATSCLVLGSIFLATLLIIILTSLGLSLTAFAPGLSLSGNSTVMPGSNLLVHGHNFLPNGSVNLTLDSGLALPIANIQTAPSSSRQARSIDTNTSLALTLSLASSLNNTLPVHSDGTFTATILVDPNWAFGRHTIYAIEAVSHRRASLPFTVAQPGATATPVPTAAPQPTATPSPTPTATAVPPPVLSCVTPGKLTLGPLSAQSAQLASAKVTLCTSGTGTLSWQASWNQNQAPWLRMNETSGSVQAPNQFQTTISASAAKLTAGTYTATVTFTGVESHTSQTVAVTLTVKGSCVNAAPQSLSFTGVEGTSDPADAQNITITNCGQSGSWSASIDNGSDWLSLNANQGSLQGGATKTLTVTASNLKAELRAGTYHDTITITLGTDSSTVTVTLVVQSAPTPTPTPTPPPITANPGHLAAGSAPCTTGNEGGSSICAVTLTNQSHASALTWSVSSDGGGVTVQAESTTIPAGGTEQVTISIPLSNCGTMLTITFQAPGNSANVTWTCQPASSPG